MTDGREEPRGRAALLEEIERLRARLEEAEQTLTAIRCGEVDALVVEGPQGEHLFTLSGAERVYRVIVESMHEAAFTVGEGGTILYCNERFCSLLRVPMEGALGRDVMEFVALPQQEPLRAFLAEARTRPVNRRLVLHAVDGVLVPVLLAGSPLEIESGPSVCVVASDLTDLEASVLSLRILREHEEALQASEARYRALVEVSPDAIVVHQDGRFVFVNPAALTLYGASSPDQLIGLTVLDSIHPDDHDPAEVGINRVLQGGSVPARQTRILRLDGSDVVVEAAATPAVWQGRPAIQAVLRDVTERRQAEAAVRESEERFRLALRNAPVSVAAQDRELRFVWAYNQRSAKPEEIIGRTDADIFTAEEAVHFTAVKRRVLEEGVELREQMWVARPSGRMFLDVCWVPLRDAADRIVGVGSTTVDLTPLKLAQEQIQQQLEELRASNEITQRLNRAMVGRELRMAELKRQVNALCARLGEPAPYALEFGEKVAAPGSMGSEGRRETSPA